MDSVTTKEDLKIELVDISSIKPYEKNPRKHSKKQVQQIANSILKFRFLNPGAVDDKNVLIAGHGRYEALKLLGKTKMPVIRVKHLSEAQIKAYRIADNKIAENAEWDDNLLKVELSELSELALETDFEIEVTGFEMAEIDSIIDGDDAPPEDDPLDNIPEPDEDLVITKPGDLWQLGDHRLICGNALEEISYITMLKSSVANLIFTDSPYNVSVKKHVGGNGKIKHEEFAMASGEMNDLEFTEFLSSYMKHCVSFSTDGSMHYHCMDHRHSYEILAAGKANYTEHKNTCVWVKNNGGMGSLYRSQHEFVFVFKNGTKPHTNNIQLGAYGRYRTNVWNYAGVNSFGKNQKDLEMHPTVKPVALIMDAIKDCSKRGDIVLDPFGGSGSTLIAAEKTGRFARLIELEPKYCDVTIKRWQDLTGLDAVHAESGKTFNELSNNSNK
jgi:DNA modification methylase